MQAEESVTMDGTQHQWVVSKYAKWQYCKLCGIVRRADDKNKPCSGELPKVSCRHVWQESGHGFKYCIHCQEKRASMEYKLGIDSFIERYADIIKAKHRESHPGGCKLLSQGDRCECVLCCVDRLLEESHRLSFLLQFITVEDVGDDQFCPGVVVQQESMEDALTFGQGNKVMVSTDDDLRDVIDRAMKEQV